MKLAVVAGDSHEHKWHGGALANYLSSNYANILWQ